VTDLTSWLFDLPALAGAWLFETARQHPFQFALFCLVVLRLFGATVETGWAGVLFRFGRAVRALEPGFQWCVPVVDTVRKTRVRAVTIDLPGQRVTTADGLVYDVDVNVVYRVADPLKTLIEIDDARRGCMTVMTLAVQEVMRDRRQADLTLGSDLDEQLCRTAQPRLEPWGLRLENAGFTSIAPAGRTLRLSQLEVLVTERYQALSTFTRSGVTLRAALTLLGTTRTLVSHAWPRYRSSAVRRERRSRQPSDELARLEA
jgi:regulator of protease activity HflC (stomatin/prohibitin superfamily)